MAMPTYQFTLKQLAPLEPNGDNLVIFSWNSALQIYSVTVGGELISSEYADYLIKSAKLPMAQGDILPNVTTDEDDENDDDDYKNKRPRYRP